MKLILTSLPLVFLFAIFSCTKTTNVKTTIYDTVTQIIKDTTVSKDTTVNKDTVWESTARNPIVGLWVGTYKIDGDAIDSFYYSFAIDSNGQMTSLDADAAGNSASGAGPWHLSGTTFTASLNALGAPGNVQGITATYDSVGGTLSGQNNYTEGSGINTNFLLLRVP